jgi:hypothetical protein
MWCVAEFRNRYYFWFYFIPAKAAEGLSTA